MKNLVKTSKAVCFVLTTLVSLNLFAASTTVDLSSRTPAGTSNGGGGGVYQLPNGNVVTLPEFGILLKDATSPVETTGKTYARLPVPYTVTKETSEELEKIWNKVTKFLPGTGMIRIDVIPAPKQLIVKMDIDPILYEKIKEEYRLVLEAFGYVLDAEKFLLPAFSQENVTYILPDFVNKLNDVQRAKILIHEANMRTERGAVVSNEARVQLLVKALKIDALIEEIAFPKVGKTPDAFNVLKRLAKLKMIGVEDVFNHLMRMLMSELRQNNVSLVDIVDQDILEKIANPMLSRMDQIVIKLDPSYIQELQISRNLKSNFAEMFEGTTISFLGKADRSTHGVNGLGCGKAKWFFVPAFGSTYLVDCGDEFLQREFYVSVNKAGPFISKIADPKD